MKPPTTEELRAAAHRKVDDADEAMLISILEIAPAEDARASGYRYTAQQLASLHEASEAYKRGELATYTDETFWESIHQQTGYSRKHRDEA